MVSHFTNTQKGILLALLGYTSFAFSDICAKWLTLHYSIYQVIAMDTGVGALLLLILSPWLGGWRSMARRQDLKTHTLRCILNIGINFLTVYCFSVMPLSTIYTMIFTMPFFAALLAIPLYGEIVTRHRWLAIIIGFGGVLLALRPGAQEIDLNIMLALLSALVIAAMYVISRSLEGASVFSMGFLPIAASCLAALPLALPGFQTPEPGHLFTILLSGVFVSAGLVCLSMGFRMAPASAVAPFLYTEMIWALIFGYLVFGDVPDLWMMAGAAIIIASGLYLLITERNKKRDIHAGMDFKP